MDRLRNSLMRIRRIGILDILAFLYVHSSPETSFIDFEDSESEPESDEIGE